MTDEIANLKSDIARLNKIISVLLKQIGTLEAENGELKSAMGIKNNFSTNADSDKGGEINFSTNANFDDTGKESFSTDVNFGNTVTEDFSTNVNSDNGGKNNFTPDAKTGNGGKTNFTTNVKTGSGAKTNFTTNADVLPPYIEVNKESVEKLVRLLKSHFPSTRQRNARQSTACELLLLHNAASATSRELRKAAGLSVPGFEKHLPILRRRGLIEKVPPGKYRLTQYSREILSKAFS